VRLGDYLHDVHGVDCKLSIRGTAKKAVLTMTTAGSGRFLELVAPYVHPSMDYKLLPRLRGQFAVQPQFVEPSQVLVPARVLSVEIKPQTRSMHRFDIEVDGPHNAGTHNYFVDGVMVHNSPETTTGGKALKFYASVRLDVRRIETLKDGTDPVGNRTRVKVVKNKVAPPFKQAEFDIIYGFGISREGGLIDMGVEHGFVRKAGAWYTYEGDQLGQGKENARSFLKDNPDLSDEIEKKIKEKLGIGPRVDRPAELTAEVPVATAPVTAQAAKAGRSVRKGSARTRPVKDAPIVAVPVEPESPKDLPVRDASVGNLPPGNLPARDLPARDLPVRAVPVDF
jgi:recombination protein RecA